MDKITAITLILVVLMLSLLSGFFAYKTGMGAEKVILSLISAAFGAIGGGVIGYAYGKEEGENVKKRK